MNNRQQNPFASGRIIQDGNNIRVSRPDAPTRKVEDSGLDQMEVTMDDPTINDQVNMSLSSSPKGNVHQDQLPSQEEQETPEQELENENHQRSPSFNQDADDTRNYNVDSHAQINQNVSANISRMLGNTPIQDDVHITNQNVNYNSQNTYRSTTDMDTARPLNQPPKQDDIQEELHEETAEFELEKLGKKKSVKEIEVHQPQSEIFNPNGKPGDNKNVYAEEDLSRFDMDLEFDDVIDPVTPRDKIDLPKNAQVFYPKKQNQALFVGIPCFLISIILIIVLVSVFAIQKRNTVAQYRVDGHDAIAQVTNKVYFDININGMYQGRIVIGLFGKTVPITTRNFLELCTGANGKSEYTGTLLTYKHSKFHSIYSNLYAAGGDITKYDGSGGESIYSGRQFIDENFILRHSRPYLLSMQNSGPNSNDSKFIITFNKMPWLDGKNVVFGEVLKGQEVVEQIQLLGTQSGRPRGRKVVRIINSGELPM